MGGELVAHCDFRPFFMRAVGESGIVDKADFIRELAFLTVEVAGRHGSSAKIDNLETAASQVCGVISLALLEKSQGNLLIASIILRQEGPTRLFRMGWGMILRLVDVWGKQGLKSVSRSELELDALNLVEASENKDWLGWLFFKREFGSAKRGVDKKKLINFLVKKFFKVEESARRVRHSRDLVETGFTCLAAGKTFRQALSLDEANSLVIFFADNQEAAVALINQRLEALRKKIPSSLQEAFNSVVEDYRRNQLNPLRESLSQGAEAIARVLNEKLVISDSADAGMKAIFRDESKRLKYRGTRSLLDDLGTMPGAPEASDVYREVVRSALIAELINRLHAKVLTSQDLSDLIAYSQVEELAGKIQWRRLNWALLEDAYIALGDEARERWFLAELFSLRTTASGKLWWSQRPPSVDYYFRQHNFAVKTRKPRQKKK
jgi:hypothetical protein